MNNKKIIFKSLIAIVIATMLLMYNVVSFAEDNTVDNTIDNTTVTNTTPTSTPTDTNVKKSITELKSKISTVDRTYLGEERKPPVKLYDNGKELKNGKDFEVEYKHNVKTGKATILVTGIGNYTGTIKKYFYIVPKRNKILKVESSSDFKKATITWKKDKMASGYVIYMATKKDGEYQKIKTIKDYKTTEYTKKNLKPKKEYYFKIRPYKIIKSTEEKKFSKKYSKVKARGNLLAEVTLTAKNSGANRKYNLDRACKIINGYILKPGETFNWFIVVGPASAARGFKMASIFKNGQVSKGYGGGVCQVSSTIYQASKKAGLEIVERHIHSRPVTYTKLGNDATVSYGVQNLRVKNTKSYPIKLVMYAEGESTTCKMYGLVE